MSEAGRVWETSDRLARQIRDFAFELGGQSLATSLLPPANPEPPKGPEQELHVSFVQRALLLR